VLRTKHGTVVLWDTTSFRRAAPLTHSLTAPLRACWQRLGTAKSKNVSIRSILFDNSPNLNRLSLARLFLFASRDLWFEVTQPPSLCLSLSLALCLTLSLSLCLPQVPLPFFLRTAVADGGLGLPRTIVGTFLALYIIVYGQMQVRHPYPNPSPYRKPSSQPKPLPRLYTGGRVQSYTPQLVVTPLGQDPPNKYVGVLWVYLIMPITLSLAGVLQFSPIFQGSDETGKLAVLVTGVAVFAIVFAINSSVHRCAWLGKQTQGRRKIGS
jgi:hypothetical protein